MKATDEYVVIRYNGNMTNIFLRFEYLWQDSENYKRPTKMPAPTYIEHLMGWVQSNIDNEAVFPSRIGMRAMLPFATLPVNSFTGVPFPKSFPSMIRQVFKRMYRVYAHIYCHHYPVVRELGLEAHLNTSFKHYVLFIDEHNLASGKDFWGPLGDLVDSMLRSD
jgi:MOB kinase activator 1